MQAKSFNEIPKGPRAKTFSQLIRKFNPYHDSRGRFTSAGGAASFTYKPGASSAHDNAIVREKDADFRNADLKTFAASVVKSKATIPEDTRWRVTAHTEQELQDWYSDAKFHVTDGGSTIAVSSDGDIVSVSHTDGDPIRGKQLMKMAVDNGGVKLDSYDGNHGFYTKCGFEPVSWCEWSDEFAPADWITANGFTQESWQAALNSGQRVSDSSLKVQREDIIFYKHTGVKSTETADAFKQRVSASAGYDEAMEARNSSIK